MLKANGFNVSQEFSGESCRLLERGDALVRTSRSAKLPACVGGACSRGFDPDLDAIGAVHQPVPDGT